MPSVYKGSQKQNKIYKGSSQIGKIYKGSSLVYSKASYNPGFVILESQYGGSYTVTLLDTAKYQVYIIGAGGSGDYESGSTIGAGGGSGSGFIGVVKLNAGTYTVVVGTKEGSSRNSKIGSAITAYGGGNASSRTAGSGGALPAVNVTVYSSTLKTKGNNGTVKIGNQGEGGAAVYSNYGRGGNSYHSSSTAKDGYVKIVYNGVI